MLQQLYWLLILSVPVACVAWTVTHEEVFREAREFCAKRSQACRRLMERKFFYLFTCEYCFSHYISAFFIWFAHFKLLLENWRGYVLSFFAVVFVSNIYMSLYGRLRVDIRAEKKAIEVREKQLEKLGKELDEIR